jgi:hypothetical protein
MKPCIVTLAPAIFVTAASIAYAASTTVDINAIDVNGIGNAANGFAFVPHTCRFLGQHRAGVERAVK